MKILAAGASLLISLAAAILFGLLTGLAWMTHLKLIVQIAIGAASLVFLLWPLAAMHVFARIAGFHPLQLSFAVSTLITIVTVPFFAAAHEYTVARWIGIEPTPVFETTTILAFGCAALGIAYAFWLLRRDLLR